MMDPGRLVNALAVIALSVAASAAHAAAADSGASLVAPTPPLYELSIERAFLDGLLTTPPFDLWRDPRAQAAVQEFTLQISRLLDQEGMPLVPILEHATLFRVRANADDQVAVENCRIDTGSLTASLTALLQGIVLDTSWSNQPSPPDAATVDGITGRMRHRLLVGQRQQSVYIGDPAFIGQLVQDLPNGTPPYAFSADYTQGARLLARSAREAPPQDPRKAMVAAWMPDAATCHPVASVTVDTGPAGWADRCVVSGLGRLPLHPIDAQLAAAFQDHAQMSVAAGLTPAVFAALAASLGDEPIEGALYPLLAQYGTGDVLVQGGWSSGLIPDLTVVTLLTQPEACLPALAAAVTALHGTVSSVSGTTHAWSIPCATGPVTLAVFGRRLVLATSDALASTAGSRTRTQPPAPWAGDVTVAVRLDLPVLATHWLPFAYQLAAGQEGDIGIDPLDPLSSLMQLYQTQPHLAPQQELTLLGSSGLVHSLLLKDQGAVAALGLYLLDPASVQAQAHPSPASHLLALHTAAGYVLILPSGQRTTLTSLVAVQTALAGYTLEGGTPAESLPLLSIAPRPHFSSRWLPPLPVVLAHLRPYACDVHADQGLVQAHETGLPLVPLLTVALASLDVDNLNEQLALDGQHDRMLERQEAKAAAQLAAPAPAAAPGAKPVAPPPTPTADQGF